MVKDKSRQYRVFVLYMAPHIDDRIAIVDTDFLTDLLSMGENSPMYKAIIKSGLAVKFSMCGHIRDSYNTFVGFGFEGIAEDDVEKVISAVQETLEKCHNEGFQQEKYDALIHENELYSNALTSNMGFKYTCPILIPTMYGVDPYECLDKNFYTGTVRKHLKENPNYYKELIKTAFLDNTHKLTVVVKPVEGYVDKINQKIKDDLTDVKNHLTQEQIHQIVNNYKLLKEKNEKPNPVDLLPSIKKSDIDVNIQYDHITKVEDDVSIFSVPLNGLTYLDFEMKVNFTHPLFCYLPILTDVIKSVGAGDLNDEQIETFSKLNCSGLGFNVKSKASLDNVDDGCVKIIVSTFCLDKNVDETVKLLNMVFFEPNLMNIEKVKTLVQAKLRNMNNKFKNRGDSLLSNLVPSGLTNSSATQNVINGSFMLNFFEWMLVRSLKLFIKKSS